MMRDFIRYKRFVEVIDNDKQVQEFLDKLSSEGWEIIYYNETPKTLNSLSITVVAGKRKEIV
jgi:hypothetical protein